MALAETALKYKKPLRADVKLYSSASFFRAADIEEGDWDFLDIFFQEFELELVVDETLEIGTIDFTIGTIFCNNLDIDDFIANGSGTSTQYDYSFLVSGISLSCEMDYE